MVVSTVCDQISAVPAWHIALRGLGAFPKVSEDGEMSEAWVDDKEHGSGYLVEVKGERNLPLSFVQHLLAAKSGTWFEVIGKPKTGKTTLLLLLGVALAKRYDKKVLFVTDAPYSLAKIVDNYGWYPESEALGLQTPVQVMTLTRDYLWLPPDRQEFLSYAPDIVLIDCTDTVHLVDDDRLGVVLSLCKEVGCTYCTSWQANKISYPFGDKVFIRTKGEKQQ